MDTERFDALAKFLATSGTRRRLLSLLTSVSLAGGLAAVLGQEAAANRPGPNRRAHNHRHSGRRKDKRQQEREQDEGGDPEIFQKGISMVLNNHIDQRTFAELGILISGSSGGCRSPAPFDMPPLTGLAIYDTQHPESYSWVENQYFFGFFNPETGLPVVWVAQGGSSKGNCHRGGTRLLNDYGLTVDQAVTVTVANRRFVITRRIDTDFKVFVVDIFAT
jgi:hypothetical protein